MLDYLCYQDYYYLKVTLEEGEPSIIDTGCFVHGIFLWTGCSNAWVAYLHEGVIHIKGLRLLYDFIAVLRDLVLHNHLHNFNFACIYCLDERRAHQEEQGRLAREARRREQVRGVGCSR